MFAFRVNASEQCFSLIRCESKGTFKIKMNGLAIYNKETAISDFSSTPLIKSSFDNICESFGGLVVEDCIV